MLRCPYSCQTSILHLDKKPHVCPKNYPPNNVCLFNTVKILHVTGIALSIEQVTGRALSIVHVTGRALSIVHVTGRALLILHVKGRALSIYQWILNHIFVQASLPSLKALTMY